jgi:hypothetical protein
MSTKLLTRTGELVTLVTIPPMNPPPEMVCWGQRLFVRNERGEYREGCCWFAPGSFVGTISA